MSEGGQFASSAPNTSSTPRKRAKKSGSFLQSFLHKRRKNHGTQDTPDLGTPTESGELSPRSGIANSTPLIRPPSPVRSHSESPSRLSSLLRSRSSKKTRKKRKTRGGTDDESSHKRSLKKSRTTLEDRSFTAPPRSSTLLDLTVPVDGSFAPEAITDYSTDTTPTVHRKKRDFSDLSPFSGRRVSVSIKGALPRFLSSNSRHAAGESSRESSSLTHSPRTNPLKKPEPSDEIRRATERLRAMARGGVGLHAAGSSEVTEEEARAAEEVLSSLENPRVLSEDDPEYHSLHSEESWSGSLRGVRPQQQEKRRLMKEAYADSLDFPPRSLDGGEEEEDLDDLTLSDDDEDDLFFQQRRQSVSVEYLQGSHRGMLPRIEEVEEEFCVSEPSDDSLDSHDDHAEVEVDTIELDVSRSPVRRVESTQGKEETSVDVLTITLNSSDPLELDGEDSPPTLFPPHSVSRRMRSRSTDLAVPASTAPGLSIRSQTRRTKSHNQPLSSTGSEDGMPTSTAEVELVVSPVERQSLRVPLTGQEKKERLMETRMPSISAMESSLDLFTEMNSLASLSDSEVHHRERSHSSGPRVRRRCLSSEYEMPSASDSNSSFPSPRLRRRLGTSDPNMRNVLLLPRHMRRRRVSSPMMEGALTNQNHSELLRFAFQQRSGKSATNVHQTQPATSSPLRRSQGSQGSLQRCVPTEEWVDPVAVAMEGAIQNQSLSMSAPAPEVLLDPHPSFLVGPTESLSSPLDSSSPSFSLPSEQTQENEPLSPPVHPVLTKEHSAKLLREISKRSARQQVDEATNQPSRRLPRLGGAIDYCQHCGTVVYQMEKLSVGNSVWHRNCYRCAKCDRKLPVHEQLFIDGHPYCQAHYNMYVR